MTATPTSRTQDQGESNVERAQKRLERARAFQGQAMSSLPCAVDLNDAFKVYKQDISDAHQSVVLSPRLEKLARELDTTYAYAWTRIFSSGIISRAEQINLLVRGEVWSHPVPLLAQKWDVKVRRLMGLGCVPDTRAGWLQLKVSDQCLWIEYIINLLDALEHPKQYGLLDFTDGVTKAALVKSKLSNRETLGKAIAACGIKIENERSHKLKKEDCILIACNLYNHYKQKPKKEKVATWAKQHLGIDVTSIDAPPPAPQLAKKKHVTP